MAKHDLFAIASNSAAKDTDRIAALKELLLDVEGDVAIASRVADLAAKIVLDRSDNLLVRQHAAQELALYPRPSSADDLIPVLCDADEDIDLRVNLLDAFQQWHHPSRNKLGDSLGQNDPLNSYL